MRLLPLLFLALPFLAACGRSPDPQSDTAKPAAAKATATAAAPTTDEFLVETSSPDQAVKTWWRYRDLLAAEALKNCQRELSEPPPAYQKHFDKFVGGEILAVRNQDPRVCTQDVISRDIDEVKTESETRAIVFATIKNVTPVPPGAVPDDHEREWRANGFKFKYLVEKSAGAWKISQVYSYEAINKRLNMDPWEKKYKADDRPRYPAFVHSP